MGQSGTAAVPGIIFWGVAVYLFYHALGMPTDFDGVANLQAMHVQTANIALAVGAAVVGTIFLCTSLILSALASTLPAE